MQEKGYGPTTKASEGDKAKNDEEANAASSSNPANDRFKHFHPRDC